MRIITMSDGIEYGTNDLAGGVFARKANDGNSWAQWAGTLDTPVFRTPEQFRRYLRVRYGIKGVRIVAVRRWNR